MDLQIKEKMDKDSKNEQEMDELEFGGLANLDKEMEEYMNDTYGKVCGDKFTFRAYGDSMMGSIHLFFDSQRFPDHDVIAVCSNFTEQVATNYMEIYYQEPITAGMKELADEIFDGKCHVFYDGGAWAPDIDYDYTCTQERFEQEHGVSFEILLGSESEWNSVEKLEDITNKMIKTFDAAKIKLRTIIYVMVSEFPKEKYFDCDSFLKENKSSVKKCITFVCTKGTAEIFSVV